MPKDKHQDLDFIIGQLDWEKNVDTHFKEHNYLEPIVDKKAAAWATPTTGSSTATSMASNSSARKN